VNQDKQDTKNEGSSVQDLTVNEEQAGEVKGGAQIDYFLRLEGLDGESRSAR